MHTYIGMEDRRVCSSCRQELGRTALYRHLTDKTGNVCPEKKRPRTSVQCHTVEDSDSNFQQGSSSPRALNSTFELCSSDEGEQVHNSVDLPTTGDSISSSSDDDTSSSYNAFTAVRRNVSRAQGQERPPAVQTLRFDATNSGRRTSSFYGRGAGDTRQRLGVN